MLLDQWLPRMQRTQTRGIHFGDKSSWPTRPVSLWKCEEYKVQQRFLMSATQLRWRHLWARRKFSLECPFVQWCDWLALFWWFQLMRRESLPCSVKWKLAYRGVVDCSSLACQKWFFPNCSQQPREEESHLANHKHLWARRCLSHHFDLSVHWFQQQYERHIQRRWAGQGWEWL